MKDIDYEQPSAEESLRERKKRATALAIRLAAIDLVIARGFANVTVDDIAHAAQVSPRTFFNYYPSKEAAVLGFDPRRNEHLCEALLGRPATESPLQAVGAIFLDEVARSADDWEEVAPKTGARQRIMRAVKQDPHLAAAFRATATALETELAQALAVRMGMDPKDPYPATVIAAVNAAVKAAIFHTGFDKPIEDILAAVRQALAVLAQGCAAPPRDNTGTVVAHVRAARIGGR